MTNKLKTLNDKAWEKIFDKYSIIGSIRERGIYEISAKEIGEFREARLMTKFDHRSNLPTLFKRNHLSILPITRGSYIIADFEAYHDFEPPENKTNTVSIPSFIHSIDFNSITSEATAINVAYLSGILADFIEEEMLWPTVNGRMSSGKFDYIICGKKTSNIRNISVENSQIEIDGGYEGYNSLTLIEAKNSLSDNFLVRQLYYPYRLWQSKLQKSVKPIFLTYSNGVFSLYEYVFKEVKNYNSLVLVKQRNYSLEQERIKLEDIISIADRVLVANEPKDIPFPQADSFRRIINICELLNKDISLSREHITYKYDFDVRQTNYYTSACVYLGLIDKEYDRNAGVRYHLTSRGKSILGLSIKYRNLRFVESILEKRVFNKVFRMYLLYSELPSTSKIVEIMKEVQIYGVEADSTYSRRASTVVSWINWILDLTN
ncbi:type II restriction enzyme [Stomatohabitans albus]|uniref:type II restriction enzyme n=2 Tax=Stomatohabitans albus TaxID=3110766 RepID=UPI00300D83C9